MRATPAGTCSAPRRVCGINDLASRAHPPLGKWLIGSGIAAFGYEPFGWRVAVAAAGTLSVALVYFLAWRLLRGVAPGRGATVGAIAASGLLAVDFLHLVHSRVGMLDAFIALFVIGAVTFAVLDRDRDRERPEAPVVVAPRARPAVAPAGRRLPGCGNRNEVVGRLRRAGRDRAGRRLGDRRSAATGAGRWMVADVHRRLPARGAADDRDARDRAAGGLRRQLHRTHARRNPGVALADRIGLARDLGSPAGDARLPHHARRRSPLPVAPMVVAAPAPAGGLLVQ